MDIRIKGSKQYSRNLEYSQLQKHLHTWIDLTVDYKNLDAQKTNIIILKYNFQITSL